MTLINRSPWGDCVPARVSLWGGGGGRGMSHVTGTAVFLATKISTYKFGKVTNDHCSTGNNNTGIYKVLNQTQITIL